MFFVLVLLARTVQFKLTQCIVHEKTTIKIIYAGRTGPDSADQDWSVPTRAGPGGTEQGRAGMGNWAGMGHR